MKQLLLELIRFYQKYLSLDSGWARKLYLTDRVCRFEPRCSEYACQAVDKYGILKGAYLGLKRIMRCNPWSAGGADPVV